MIGLAVFREAKFAIRRLGVFDESDIKAELESGNEAIGSFSSCLLSSFGPVLQWSEIEVSQVKHPLGQPDIWNVLIRIPWYVDRHFRRVVSSACGFFELSIGRNGVWNFLRRSASGCGKEDSALQKSHEQCIP